MNGLLTVFRREVAQYFVSPFAYVIAAAVLLLTGILFRQDLVEAMGVRPANAALVPAVFAASMVLFAPLLTMRLLAEERREGTLELLLTSPVPESSIVIGKFLGVWFYFTVILLLTLVYPIILLSIATPDIGQTVSAYIGIWLYAGATLAVGMMFSALTENQIVAAFLSFITLLLLWAADQAGSIISNIDIARVVRELSLQGNFSTSFAAGLLRAEDAAYFAGIIAVMLFITVRIVEANRWRT